ncbi:hypothetical protein C2845_PM01G43590 [Panicum miliaceum]|uniref:Uncharacterized protein n=1 Tax=Panicum miliaceum TaxID=4540 RepID=A0A3L6TI38_PANMI|nr:hypothetical protein C2845_PM01G43590 [Panicum miliaceum]
MPRLHASIPRCRNTAIREHIKDAWKQRNGHEQRNQEVQDAIHPRGARACTCLKGRSGGELGATVKGPCLVLVIE